MGTALDASVRCNKGILGCNKEHPVVPQGCMIVNQMGKCLKGTEGCRVYHIQTGDDILTQPGSADAMLQAVRDLNPKPYRTHTARMLSTGPTIAMRCHPNNPHGSHAACTEPWCECSCHETAVERATRVNRSTTEDELLRHRIRADASRGISKALL